jgi:4-oxalocrotonate tautomerase
MPHVIVKLWPGQSEERKKKLAHDVTRLVMSTLHYGEESVSVAIEEIDAEDWMEKVFNPDIRDKPSTIYKKPGYDSV